MKEKTIILLEKRGCDFSLTKDNYPSYIDLTNHRYFTKGLYINKKCVGFEITSGYMWKRTLKNGRKLKKPKVLHNYKLWAQSYYEDEKGMCWTLLDVDKEINNQDLLYTKLNLINAINKLNKYKIDDVLIVNSIYNKIEDQAGYREKAVLNNCCRITETMKNKEHHVIKFYNTEGYSFTYDIITNKIVG